MNDGLDLNELGQRIRTFRKSAVPALTQARLAEAAGLSAGYLSELESGEATKPSGQILMKIATALGITIADLLGTAAAAPVVEINDSLKEFAKERNLIEGDVLMLASIRFRNEQPQTVRRWAHIYDTIRNSKLMDQELE